MTLDADARTVTVTRTSLIEGLSVFCTFRDAAGESTNFDCQISSAGITALETVFDNVNDLPDLALVAGSSPATITLQDQTVVRIAASSGRIHTAWAGADALGDGRYRCLFRLPQDAASVLDRRFDFRRGSRDRQLATGTASASKSMRQAAVSNCTFESIQGWR